MPKSFPHSLPSFMSSANRLTPFFTISSSFSLSPFSGLVTLAAPPSCLLVSVPLCTSYCGTRNGLYLPQTQLARQNTPLQELARSHCRPRCQVDRRSCIRAPPSRHSKRDILVLSIYSHNMVSKLNPTRGSFMGRWSRVPEDSIGS